MNRWEYQLVEVPYGRKEDVAAKLDSYGNDGWEIVSMHIRASPDVDDNGGPLPAEEELVLLLKRPKADAPKPSGGYRARSVQGI
jgi:hypothetical protein